MRTSTIVRTPWATSAARPDGVRRVRTSDLTKAAGLMWPAVSRRQAARVARVERALPVEDALLTSELCRVAQLPWQRLYFLPLPHQHGSLRPILGPLFVTGAGLAAWAGLRARCAVAGGLVAMLELDAAPADRGKSRRDRRGACGRDGTRSVAVAAGGASAWNVPSE